MIGIRWTITPVDELRTQILLEWRFVAQFLPDVFEGLARTREFLCWDVPGDAGKPWTF